MSGRIQRPSSRIYRIDACFFRLSELIHGYQKLMGRLPLGKGMKVVDYGCGIGRYAIPVAEAIGEDGKVFAIDIQPLAIRKVQDRAAKRGLKNVQTILVDSYNTGIDDSSIDMVMVIDTIHRIEDREALFHELHRILKPDGRIFLDRGHISMSKAKDGLEESGLFSISEGGDDYVMLDVIK